MNPFSLLEGWIGRLSLELCKLHPKCLEFFLIGPDVYPQLGQLSCQFFSPFQSKLEKCQVRFVVPSGERVSDRPLAYAALGSRPIESYIFLTSAGKHFHLVQMQKSAARQLHTNPPGLSTTQLYHQRWSHLPAIKQCPIMLINLVPLRAILREENFNRSVPVAASITAIMEHHPIYWEDST
jgi:hypothetical protein